MYQTICKLCKLEGEQVSYIGETSRSLYERTREHLRDYWDDKSKSHMREHFQEQHRDEVSKCTADREIMERFEVKIVEKYRTALTRQVGEAIHIRGARGALLNDRDEYNRCELPKLSVTKARQKDPVTEGDLRKQRETENLVETLAETQHKRRNRDETEERNSREPERETQNKRRRDNTQVTQRTHPQRDKRTGETGEVVNEVNLRDDTEVV